MKQIATRSAPSAGFAAPAFVLLSFEGPEVARCDPDKRRLMAMDAVGGLKTRGLRPLLIARGGIEAHGREA